MTEHSGDASLQLKGIPILVHFGRVCFLALLAAQAMGMMKGWEAGYRLEVALAVAVSVALIQFLSGQD